MIRKIEFWVASFIGDERDGVRHSVKGYQVVFERARDSAFVFRRHSYPLIGLVVREAAGSFGSIVFRFVSWVEAYERFHMSFYPSKVQASSSFSEESSPWIKLLDVCQPNMFVKDLFFLSQKAFSRPIGKTGANDDGD